MCICGRIQPGTSLAGVIVSCEYWLTTLADYWGMPAMFYWNCLLSWAHVVAFQQCCYWHHSDLYAFCADYPGSTIDSCLLCFAAACTHVHVVVISFVFCFFLLTIIVLRCHFFSFNGEYSAWLVSVFIHFCDDLEHSFVFYVCLREEEQFCFAILWKKLFCFVFSHPLKQTMLQVTMKRLVIDIDRMQCCTVGLFLFSFSFIFCFLTRLCSFVQVGKNTFSFLYILIFDHRLVL